MLLSNVDNSKANFELSMSLVTTRKTLDLQATCEKDVKI